MSRAADSARIADARPANWVDRFAPPRWRPYLKLARADRPIGTWLLLLPGWWSVAMAAEPGHWPDPFLMILFGLGALVMRGAGCTFNDIVDRDFDGRVERTRLRPIPSGQVSVAQAVAWMVALALTGFAILLQMNGLAIALGVGSLALVAIYPFMKRVTWWPQFFLGLAFNWGAVLGWAAVRAEMAAPALVMYVAGIAWTLGYDTIYAHQDKEDDALIGVKSTARFLAEQTPRWLFGFYAVTVAGLVLAGALAGLHWPFHALMIGAIAHLIWQAATVRIDDPTDCLTKFRSNRDFGLIVLAAIIAGRML